jgi:hypothetical protein
MILSLINKRKLAVTLAKKNSNGDKEFGSVEFEVLLAAGLLIAIALLFWDVAVSIVVRQRQEMVAFIMATDFMNPPLKVTQAGTGAADIETLTDAEADTFLDTLITDARSEFQTIGSGAGSVTNNVMMELHYLSIYNTGDAIPPAEIRTSGYAYGSTRKGSDNYAGSSNAADCFDSDDGAEFDAFVTEKLNRITDYDVATDPPIGTKVYEAEIDGATVTRYLEQKPILFIMMCSKPPRVAQSSSILTFRVLFPPKEVRFG